MSHHADRLRSIKTFDELILYLQDELDWPLEEYSFDELTFEYSPAELGLREEQAAKVKAIHQLRPLQAGQPWGVFFVEFDNQRMPVVVLRRILSHLVLKKRAAANQAQRAAWLQGDLLFISAFGSEASDQREIAFAHFHQGAGDLPTLRVLGWDGADTGLKLDYVAATLQQRLRWPADPDDRDAWREQWSQAFRHGIGHQIKTSDMLAERLAVLARAIRGAASTLMAYETEHGPLRRLHKAFQSALIHDLTEEQFADTYAQTVTYGLLTAAIQRTDLSGGALDTTLYSDMLADVVPVTNPFLKEMLQTFLQAGGRQGGIDFDELGIQDVVELLRGEETDLPAILRDFGNKTRGEDPVIHFYEHFLASYDKQIKVRRGVFNTPQPVVSYIVRSVHELLQTEFGIEDGLASTVTWREMAGRLPGLAIPEGTDPASPFVVILDPATGTATFPVEVIDVIFKTMEAKWKRQGLSEAQRQAAWNAYVPQHLLPRLYGYELMMAPYAIAHMKIGLKLHETGYRFASPERVRVFLTNALEPANDGGGQLAFVGWTPALAHEAQAVNAVKQHQRFTVVMGNPPYSGISANMTEAIINLVEPYKSIDGTSLGERKIWAQDDYKKFFRLAQLIIEKAKVGVLGFITNHGFISEPTSRGMRHNLLSTFSRISVLDLHGSLKKREVCPDGGPDKNVFEIEPGVAISLFRRGGAGPQSASHSDLWGLREEKYRFLWEHSVQSTTWSEVIPAGEFYLLVPQNVTTSAEFKQLLGITDVFELGSNGIQTSRDHVVYSFDPAECHRVIMEFRLPEAQCATWVLRDKYWPGKRVANYEPGDTRGWHVPHARIQLRSDHDWESRFTRALYRPFDQRTLFYADYMIDWPRTEVMGQMQRPNHALCVGRAGSAADNQEWNVVFVADSLVDMNLFYRGGNVTYPLRSDSMPGRFSFDPRPQPNFKRPFVDNLAKALNLAQTGEFGLPDVISPEDILNYIYAIFHSPTYRTRYAEFLKIDFPRVPLTSSLALFRALAALGGELVALHLLESPALARKMVFYDGPEWPRVEKVSYGDEFVWLDKACTYGFDGVPEAVWNFRIGGYQVCEKWLKDRGPKKGQPGRLLSPEDIDHYQRIVVALNETMRIMGEIDAVIEEHGGWPIE